ncbi:MAG: hypothetical protein LC781_19310 [Actinobacteria bacterium]|nr:hypothetical protein [Actinomycetota bacterium]
MEAPMRERGRPLVYEVRDLISIPEDVPALEVERGDQGIIRELVLLNDSVTAFVEIPYSTGQTRGWILVEIMPETKVLSYTLEG